MTQPALVYHWSQSEFLRAWEAGAFDHRVELVPLTASGRASGEVGAAIEAFLDDVVWLDTPPAKE